MKTTNYYLDQLAKRDQKGGGTGSDYALAKRLKTSGSRISNYRRGISRFDNSTCVIVAQMLGLPEGEVLANIHAEREKDPALVPIWEKMAKAARSTAALALFALVAIPALSTYSNPARAEQNSSSIVLNQGVTINQCIHYAQRLIRCLARSCASFAFSASTRPMPA